MSASAGKSDKSRRSSKKRSSPRPAKTTDKKPLHPILALQQTIGNQALQRLIGDQSQQIDTYSGGQVILRENGDPPAADAPKATTPKNIKINISPGSAVVFKSGKTALDGVKVHFTGRMSIKGKASLIGEELPTKDVAKILTARVRELMKEAFTEAKPKGGESKLEVELGGETLTLELEPGAKNFPAFQVSARFSAGNRKLVVPGCEVTGASITLDATAWISPIAAVKSDAAEAGDASVKSYGFAGKKADLSDGDKRTGGVSQKKAMDDFEARVPAFVKDHNFLKLPEQRATFFQQMRSYFGTDENTIDHFAKLRKANIVGAKTILHDEAATRLEQVQAELGEENMPRSGGVAWPRSETKMGGHQSLRNLHNIGFAIDFNAYQTPMITDQRKLDMIRIITGRSPSAEYGEPKGFDKKDVGETYTSGTDEEKEKLDAEPKITKWLDGVEQEAEALSKASEAFRGSLKGVDESGVVIDLAPKLQELREKWFNASTEAEKKKILTELQVVIKPWLNKVEAERKDEKKKIETAGFDPSKMPAGEELKKKAKQAKNLEKQMDKLKGKLGATLKKGQRDQLDAFIIKASNQLGEEVTKLSDDAAAVTKFNELHERIAALQKALGQTMWLNRVTTLQDALKNNAEFVFGAKMGSAVKNPSLAQITDLGFFNLAGMDKAGRGAFSPAFVKAMVKHGFTHGATWSGPDYMHFELRWKGAGMK